MMPRSMLARALAALLLAAACIAALVLVLQQQELQHEEHALAARAHTPRSIQPRTDLPPLGRTAQPVLVCADESELPASAAPLLRVLPDGSVAMVRPAPLAQRPGQVAETVPTVLLPCAVGALNPAQRGGLLECIGALVAERPVPEGAVQLAGAGGWGRDLGRLLTWLP